MVWRYVAAVAAPTLALIVASFTDPMAAGSAVATQAVPSLSPSAQREMLQRYCVGCHNERGKATAGNLALDGVDPANAAGHAETLERVVRKLRVGLMPPPGRPRPEPTEYHQLLISLQSTLDQAAAAHPNPGRKDTFHRLNRTEYRNIVHDLFDLDLDVTELLPIDNPSFGFDNIAGTLTLNEALMEQYIAAAQQVASSVLGSSTAVEYKEFRAAYEFSQDERLEGFPMGTRGGLRAAYTFPRDGDYTFEVKMMCGSVIAAQGACGGAFPDTHQMEVTLDGERLQLITLPKKGSPDGEARDSYKLRASVKGGPHQIAVWFLKQPSIDEFDGVRKKFDKPMHPSNAVSTDWMAVYQPSVSSVTVGGPFNPSGPGNTPSRRRVLVCTPAGAADEAVCARRILSTLARRAYRRPVTAAEVEGLMTFFTAGRRDGFEGGIDLAMRRVLTSPNFLFRIETDPADVAVNANYRVSDLELASRLSFFLWRSAPDDELIDVATRGRLRNHDVLAEQVKRMLADPRAQRMTPDFARQWLGLGKVDVAVPNAQMFPNFDDSLKLSMRRETELFVDSIRTEDRNVVDLLTADYTFLNERLAKHYAIPNVKGGYFRRVAYPSGNPRRGLLGQGSVLLLTSSPIRTRPVVRGKWILETLLGTPPPAPPPNVPALQETGAVLAKTMRERMAAHRANAVCTSCHSTIDPLGFALENFSPVGQYRTVDDNFTRIDASGTLPDGSQFDTLASFRENLLRDPEVFVSTFVEKLMIYTLGRGLEYYDMPAVRSVVHQAAADDYRFSAIVQGIVTSLPFEMRRGPAEIAPAKKTAQHQH